MRDDDDSYEGMEGEEVEIEKEREFKERIKARINLLTEVSKDDAMANTWRSGYRSSIVVDFMFLLYDMHARYASARKHN